MAGRWTGSGPVGAAESADLLYRLTPAAIAAAAMMATLAVTILPTPPGLVTAAMPHRTVLRCGLARVAR